MQKESTPKNSSYSKGVMPTLLVLGAGLVGLATLGPVAAAGTIAIGGAVLGAGALSRHKNSLDKTHLGKKLHLLFGAIQELAHLTLEVDRLKELDITLLSEGPTAWIRDPENFHHQAYSCYKKTILCKAIYEQYRSKESEVLQAMSMIKEAIKNGSEKEKFAEWWDEPNELDLCQFLCKLKAVYPDLIPVYLNLYLDPRLESINKIMQKYIQALEVTEPYRQAYLQGMEPSLDDISSMMVNSLINIFTLENSGKSSGQAQKMSEHDTKLVIDQTVSVVSQRIITMKIYPFLEMDKMYYLLFAIVDPNCRLKTYAFNLKIKNETLQTIEGLIKKIEMIIDSSAQKGVIFPESADREGATSSVSVLAKPPCLADALRPLIEPAMKVKLVRFFSEEKEETKIQAVKQALAHIIKITLLEASPVLSMNAIDDEFAGVCRERGQKMGSKMKEVVADSVNTYSGIRYEERNVTREVIKFMSRYQRVAGYFSSWVPGFAVSMSATPNAHDQALADNSTPIVASSVELKSS